MIATCENRLLHIFMGRLVVKKTHHAKLLSSNSFLHHIKIKSSNEENPSNSDKREVIDKITNRNVTQTSRVTLSIDTANVNRQKYQANINRRKVNYFDNERSIKTSKLEHNAGGRHVYLFHWPSRLVYVSWQAVGERTSRVYWAKSWMYLRSRTLRTR